MRKFVTAIALGLFAFAAQAEASFDQIEGLIQQKNYAAAEAGLEVIIKNHPNSSKAFYAMAQAQAGLGNLEKAQKALNIATGLNPTLDFAPEGSVRKLKEAITPQTAKIEQIEESHFWRDFGIGFIIFAGGGLIILLVIQKKRKDEEDAEIARQEREAEARRVTREREEERIRQQAEASTKSTKSKKTTFTPVTSSTLAKDTKATASIATSGPAVQQPLYTPQPTHTTVVNNSNDGLLTGILIGDMMNHHHDTPRVVEREVIREVPAPKRDTSWDDTPSRSSSRSSSWDDTPSTSSSRSSSWDSDSSSSSSSSSWSSSSDDSSSSWSSSDSGSSSSWD
jgi:hypothetical protein